MLILFLSRVSDKIGRIQLSVLKVMHHQVWPNAWRLTFAVQHIDDDEKNCRHNASIHLSANKVNLEQPLAIAFAIAYNST